MRTLWRAQDMSARRFANAALPQQKASVARKKKPSKDARFVKVGLPLLLFVVGGYVGLTQVPMQHRAHSSFGCRHYFLALFFTYDVCLAM